MRPPFLAKRVHYALKCLLCLARTHGPLRANELASLTGIPPAQAAKILYLLTWAGFISSRRGSKGGFWLRKPAEQVHVQDVMDFFQPPVDGASKDDEDSVMRVWQERFGSRRRVFEKLTLADLVRESQRGHSRRKYPKENDDWRFFA